MDSGRWRDYFGFAAPYDSQGDAAASAVEVGEAGGYLAMEGPCGTGKTMAALSAGAALVREGDYERVFVVTPVKQQRQQFVEDLRTMNAGLEDPLDGISLTGKRDLCPYGREGLFPEDTSTHDRCEDLRDNTSDLVRRDDDGAAIPATASVAVGTDPDGDEQWWDPGRASDLVKAARPDGGEYEALADATLTTAGAESPYRPAQPSAPEELTETDDSPLYCPFEADWYARNKGSPLGFEAGANHVLTPAEFLPESVERGTCPHRAMQTLVESVEVVVGNYNHLFDPASRPLVASILDDDTFVVVDEAHRLEERVRDLLSFRLGRQTLRQARGDCESLLARARQSRENKQQVRDRLRSYEVSLDAVERARDFLDDVADWLDDRVETYLDADHQGWRADARRLPERDLEVPLRDPEREEADDLTEWAQREGYDGDIWRSLPAIGAAVEGVLEEADVNRSCVVTATGQTLARWWEGDHTRYLREVELAHSPAHHKDGWESVYTPALYLYDCMPADQLREVFDSVGGGVLMSATLEPLDVFTEVAGLDALEATADEETPRPVVTRTYDLRFPPENRASLAVDVEPFTRSNRGEPTQDQSAWTRTRDAYAQVLRTAARSPGNVLVAMPNYREADWAGEYLRGAVEKPVLVDESSSNEDTETLKQRFFDGDGKVLVTSARGTLTEGVDYDGDKLACCLVVGVPLVSLGSPRVRAVKHAYGEAFGEDRAFEYALTVPAVRRARQALGRVIRGTDEVGVRILADRRYTAEANYGGVHEYLSPREREEFRRMTPDFLADQLRRFWEST